MPCLLDQYILFEIVYLYKPLSWCSGVGGDLQLQQEEAQKIRDKKANEAALAALSAFGSGTKRKRPSPAEGVSSPPLSLSLSLSHTHAHARTHTHTRTHARTRTHTQCEYNTGIPIPSSAESVAHLV